MKKFLTTISFILVLILFAGCGNSQANMTKDLVNSTINQIDSIVTAANNLGNPNEESLKLSKNYNDSTMYRITEPKTFTFGDKNLNNSSNDSMPNPQNRNGRYQNNFINGKEYENDGLVNNSSLNNDYTNNQSTNNTELINLSSNACNSCRDFNMKKDNLISNCNNCKNELLNVLNNNIVLNEKQLNGLKDYSLKLTEMFNILSTCQNCQTNITDIQNQNNNNTVLLSSRYKNITDTLNQTSNYFEKTSNTINDITRLLNPNYQPNNTQNAQRNQNNNENNDYSVMPINESGDTNKTNNSGNAFDNNKRMPERLRRNIEKTRRNIINKTQRNSSKSNAENLIFKPKNVRA